MHWAGLCLHFPRTWESSGSGCAWLALGSSLSTPVPTAPSGRHRDSAPQHPSTPASYTPLRLPQAWALPSGESHVIPEAQTGGRGSQRSASCGYPGSRACPQLPLGLGGESVCACSTHQSSSCQHLSRGQSLAAVALAVAEVPQKWERLEQPNVRVSRCCLCGAFKDKNNHRLAVCLTCGGTGEGPRLRGCHVPQGSRLEGSTSGSP